VLETGSWGFSVYNEPQNLSSPGEVPALLLFLEWCEWFYRTTQGWAKMRLGRDGKSHRRVLEEGRARIGG
jgi:hypothetical protein